MLNDVRRAQQKSIAASNEAQAAYDMANDAKERSMGELTRVSELTQLIEKFTANDVPTPQNVKELAEQVFSNEFKTTGGET